jgi:hypothetical protein
VEAVTVSKARFEPYRVARVLGARGPLVWVAALTILAAL